MKQVNASVISSEETMLGVYLTWLDSPEIVAAAQPGQYVMVRCGSHTLRRPLSIHQVAGDNGKARFALLYAVLGEGTRWLAQRKAGEKVDLLGPLGNGFTVKPASRDLLLLAGGLGIAPLCFLAQQATNSGKTVKLLLGAATANQLYPKRLLPRDIEVITATDDGTAGKKGFITDCLADSVTWADQVFACGPTPMYQSLVACKPTRPVQISLEMRMGCGIGTCYGCTVRTQDGLKQVCKDGPIFDLESVVWDKLALAGV